MHFLFFQGTWVHLPPPTRHNHFQPHSQVFWTPLLVSMQACGAHSYMKALMHTQNTKLTTPKHKTFKAYEWLVFPEDKASFLVLISNGLNLIKWCHISLCEKTWMETSRRISNSTLGLKREYLWKTIDVKNIAPFNNSSRTLCKCCLPGSSFRS